MRQVPEFRLPPPQLPEPHSEALVHQSPSSQDTLLEQLPLDVQCPQPKHEVQLSPVVVAVQLEVLTDGLHAAQPLGLTAPAE